ncbi:MAG: zinc ribbon domain-containing protein [Candidatus Omnitrophica bacterium]|nr:zinc ribbon domain-containing protein [Candidatus Omnitrophota bacterium]MDD5079977.1 zinc ribbon domain-containing protein [Candidatus Omnitrophota bacterium]
MPLYEFECVKCGNKFEYLVRRAGEEVVCPKCRHGKPKKLFSVFAFSSDSGSSSSKCGGCSSHNCSSCGH